MSRFFRRSSFLSSHALRRGLACVLCIALCAPFAGERVGRVRAAEESRAAVQRPETQSSVPAFPTPTPSFDGGRGFDDGSGREGGYGRVEDRASVRAVPGGRPEGRGRSEEFRAAAPAPVRGALPGERLPNLDDARRMQAVAPRIGDAVPSERPYCWPGDPRCQPRRAVPPQPTPAPRPSPTLAPRPSPSPAPSSSPAPSPSPSPSPIGGNISPYPARRSTGERPLTLLAIADRLTELPRGFLSLDVAGSRLMRAADDVRARSLTGRRAPVREAAMKESMNASAVERTEPSAAATTSLDANCQSVWGYTAANTLVYIYQDGLDIGQT